jgi:hypothetical protein
MKHQTIDQLQAVARVEESCPLLSRAERLERWARALDGKGSNQLSTLYETEYQSPAHREEMRRDGSPIAVAFADPVLRSSGLANDTYGEAKRFFELDDGQLHNILCYCHFGDSLSAAVAAKSVRSLITPGVLARLRDRFTR